MPTLSDDIYSWGALAASAPGTFLLPRESDSRFNWVPARLEALEVDEARELVLDAWDPVCPRFLVRQVRLTLDMVRHNA